MLSSFPWRKKNHDEVISMPFRRMFAQKFSPILQLFFAFPNFWDKSIPHKNWPKLIKVQWQKRQTKRTWMLTLLFPAKKPIL